MAFLRVGCKQETDHSLEESTRAEVAERHGERECADEEDERHEEHIGHRVGDAAVEASRPGKVPAALDALGLGDTASTHFNPIVMRHAVFVEFRRPVTAVQ